MMADVDPASIADKTESGDKAGEATPRTEGSGVWTGAPGVSCLGCTQPDVGRPSGSRPVRVLARNYRHLPAEEVIIPACHIGRAK